MARATPTAITLHMTSDIRLNTQPKEFEDSNQVIAAMLTSGPAARPRSPARKIQDMTRCRDSTDFTSDAAYSRASIAAPELAPSRIRPPNKQTMLAVECLKHVATASRQAPRAAVMMHKRSCVRGPHGHRWHMATASGEAMCITPMSNPLIASILAPP
mmetsp:Transcript_33984/g.66869  ORF Transcript_33984/g.66869 Transcript_33984/m.66869 type:complete len:158 (-) Transcript_33984:1146-1619(-)